MCELSELGQERRVQPSMPGSLSGPSHTGVLEGQGGMATLLSESMPMVSSVQEPCLTQAGSAENNKAHSHCSGRAGHSWGHLGRERFPWPLQKSASFHTPQLNGGTLDRGVQWSRGKPQLHFQASISFEKLRAKEHTVPWGSSEGGQ